MALTSDITINVAKFDSANTPKKTAELNEHLIKLMKDTPKWYEVGAEKFRQMRWNNQTPLPRPPTIEAGINSTVPSRDSGRTIPVRIFKPAEKQSKGVFLHIHGGGWVLQSEHYQDAYLKFIADELDLIAISVGYRLAPEHPHPAGCDDCVDAAEYILAHGKEQYGGELLFIGGESAGGYFSVTTAFELLRRHDEPLPIKALILHYGVYELSQLLPAAHHFKKSLIIDGDIMAKYLEAFLPNTTIEQRRDPRISPFWENLMGDRFFAKLPPAFFTCGTEDPLIEDTTLMSVKWMTAAGEAVVKIYTGAPHGFTLFPKAQCEEAGEALDDMKAYMQSKLSKS